MTHHTRGPVNIQLFAYLLWLAELPETPLRALLKKHPGRLPNVMVQSCMAANSLT